MVAAALLAVFELLIAPADILSGGAALGEGDLGLAVRMDHVCNAAMRRMTQFDPSARRCGLAL